MTALLATPPRTYRVPVTIGVEPVGAELRPLLTSREVRADRIRPLSAVVARVPGGRPVVLGLGRDRTTVLGAAWELAQTYAARYVAPMPAVVGQEASCLVCGEPVVTVTAEVAGRRVPYWQHVTPAAHSDPQAHAARVAVTS